MSFRPEKLQTEIISSSHTQVTYLASISIY